MRGITFTFTPRPDRIKLLWGDFSRCLRFSLSGELGLEEEEGSGRPKNKIFAGTLNPLSGAGKEVIGSNHKSINRIPRVSKIRAESTKNTKYVC